MTNQYGPWATLIDAGGNPQLSAFWRRRLTMLVPTSRTSPVLSRRNLLWLVAAGVLMLVLPIFRTAPAVAEEKKPASQNDDITRIGVGSLIVTGGGIKPAYVTSRSIASWNSGPLGLQKPVASAIVTRPPTSITELQPDYHFSYGSAPASPRPINSWTPAGNTSILYVNGMGVVTVVGDVHLNSTSRRIGTPFRLSTVSTGAAALTIASLADGTVTGDVLFSPFMPPWAISANNNLVTPAPPATLTQMLLYRSDPMPPLKRSSMSPSDPSGGSPKVPSTKPVKSE